MKTQKLTGAYICIMLSAFLLFTGTSGYVLIARKKFLFFACLTLAWTVFTLIFALKEKSLSAAKTMPVLKFTAIYAVLCTVSTLASDTPVFTGYGTGRYNGLVTYLLYAVVFTGVLLFGKLKEHHLLLFFGAYSVCCVIAVLQYAGFNPLNLYPDGMNFYDPEIQQVYLFLGTVGNADLLSSLNCLAIPAAVCCLPHISPKRRFIPVISAISGLVCAAVSGVMSGFVALGVTLAVYGLLRLIGKNGEGRLRLILPASALGLLALACFVSVFILPDEAGSSRILIWKSCLEVFKAHPLLGIGPDCLAGYSGVVFSRFSEELGRELTAGVDNAHCELLHHLVSFGLAGLVPLAGTVVCTAEKLSRSFLAPALFCYAVQSFFNLGLPVVTPVFVILLALAYGEEIE